MTLLSARAIALQLASTTILDQVDCDLGQGEVVGLIGPNGAGKSSLLRCLAGLQPVSAGTVTLDGQPIAQIPPRERARRLAWLTQSGQVHWPLTVERLVELGRLPHLDGWSRPGAADQQAVKEALSDCDALHLAERTVTTLSGGERARVLLARALATNPTLLLADEPVAGLDPKHQLQVMALLHRQAVQGRGILVVLHDLALAARFCDRLVLIDQGRVVAIGSPNEVLRPDLLSAVYGVHFVSHKVAGIDWPLPIGVLNTTPSTNTFADRR